MEDELMRIGVSIPSRLLSAFDQVINKRGYSSRSEAIRDAIRGYLLDYESFGQIEGEQIGVITLVYNHEQRGLISLLTDIQHENTSIITSTIHIHLDATNCLEIDVVRGSAAEISGFAERMMVQSGVFQVRTFVIPALSLGSSDQWKNNNVNGG
ncbi:MAG: nickel-responsive transcriptional regulator NikR [Halobacteriota archaeon]|jgi:CopG family nickel-responsive transcriptional regulator